MPKVLITALLVVLFTSPTDAQRGWYRCVISSGGKAIYSKGGFRTHTACANFCFVNANIRSLGGAPEIRWACIRGF